MYSIISKETSPKAKQDLIHKYILQGEFVVSDLLYFVAEELEVLSLEVNALTLPVPDEGDEACELLMDEDLQARLERNLNALDHPDQEKRHYAMFLHGVTQWLIYLEKLDSVPHTGAGILRELDQLSSPEGYRHYLLLTRLNKYISNQDTPLLDYLKKQVKKPDPSLWRAYCRSALARYNDRELNRRLRLNQQTVVANSSLPRPWLELGEDDLSLVDAFLEKLALVQKEGFPAGAEADDFMHFDEAVKMHLLLFHYKNTAFRSYLAYCGRMILLMMEEPFPLSRLIKILPEIWMMHGKFSAILVQDLMSYQFSMDNRIRSNLMEGIAPLLAFEEWSDSFWPLIERHLRVPHPRLRSTALSIAFTLRPLEALQAIEEGLLSIASREDLKSMLWLISNTEGFDQDYTQELEIIEKELSLLDSPNIYAIPGIVPDFSDPSSLW
ncbi:MAG: hypothetical protein H3C47_14905 [Candidatus Cloacimonetes bacterium]|nr:hypothetical protein [Candidatus Cloacimonadota bacterium]